MKFDFRLRFTRVFVAQTVHCGPFASLFICPCFPASFPNAYESNIYDIQSYSVLDFLSTKPPLNSKRRTRVGDL